MSEYARIVNGEIVEFRDVDPSIHAAWVAAGNPKATEFRPVLEEDRPFGLDPKETVEPVYTIEPTRVVRSWTIRQLTADELRKTWTALEFLSRFTDTEMMAIENGRISDPYIQAFYRSALAAQEVVSDDPRTIAGMDYLVMIGIIDESRKSEILES